MSKLKPNFTQIPNVFLDEIMCELEKGEMKVLLYVMRRTYGFGKEKDSISFSQMKNGVTNKNGKRLDNGTGLKDNSISRSIASLEEKGLLKVNREKMTNTYSLNLGYKGTPTIGVLPPQESTTPTIGVKVLPPQEIQKKEKESIQKKDTSSASFEAFWEAYPKKLDRKACALLWRNRKLDRYLDEILTFLRKAKNTESWTKEDGRFIPYPKTFLNGEKWTDDLKGYGKRSTMESEEDKLVY